MIFDCKKSPTFSLVLSLQTVPAGPAGYFAERQITFTREEGALRPAEYDWQAVGSSLRAAMRRENQPTV